MTLTLLGTTTVTVEQQATGSYVAGVWTPGGVTPVNVVASVQPITGRERDDLPEGYRTSARYKMYTATELDTTNLTNQTAENIAIYKGRRFELISVLDWTDHIAATGHYKYILAELGTDEQ